jgi:hypothetical protein
MSVKGPQSNTAELAERYKFAQYNETAPLSPLPQVGGSGTLNPLRRWPFNLQSAVCVDINVDDTIKIATIPFGTTTQGASAVELFVFSEASPIILSAQYQIGPFFVNGIQAPMHFPTTAIDAAIYQTTTHGDYNPTPTIVRKGDGSAYTVADAVGAGAALHAVASSPDVRVKGFPFIVNRPRPAAGGTWTYVSSTGPTVNTPISLFTQTVITYQCLAASPNGFVPYLGASDIGGTLLSSTPVFLQQNQYTAAIRDNKNLITTASGNFRVVGLYDAN